MTETAEADEAGDEEELEVPTSKKTSGHSHEVSPAPQRRGEVSVRTVAQIAGAIVAAAIPTGGAYGAWSSNRDLATSNRELVVKVDQLLEAQHAMELHMAKLDAVDVNEKVKALEERVRKNAEELAELRATVRAEKR